MEAIVVITVLALLQYTWFAIETARVRVKLEVSPPAESGPAAFERTNRVHHNTLEQIVIFLPALWLYGYYVKFLWAAGFGIVYLVGRFIYRAAYLKDPESRSTGFALTILPSMVMLLWVLVVAIARLVS